jgi:hypothetical protein
MVAGKILQFPDNSLINRDLRGLRGGIFRAPGPLGGVSSGQRIKV